MDAARIMGVVVLVQGQTPPKPINENSLGLVFTNGTVLPPEGVFTIGNIPFVIDTAAHRILRYDPFEQWPPESTSFSPSARATIGQDAAQQDAPLANRNLSEPNASSFALPGAGVFAGGETYIVDSGNNRVLVLPDLSTGPPLTTSDPYRARRVLGQFSYEFRAPNFIEGREFAFGGIELLDGREVNLPSAAGVAIDTRSNPPRLYVADPANNRVLGFADARRVRPGDRADIVIGQRDCYRRIVNSPSGSATQRTASSLRYPVGVAVDAQGNLWVADSGNSRVLRFAPPFENHPVACEPGGDPTQANLVLGQLNFNSQITDASDRTMASPYGIAFTIDGNVLVSDSTHNRVLLFTPPFTNGMAASRAFGQPDLNSTGAGNIDSRLNGPRGISTDTDDRLYVCDTGNNRIMIFSRAPGAGPDPRAAFILTRNLTSPFGVSVSPLSGDIWVANTGVAGASARTIVRYPKFDTLQASGDNSNYSMPGNAVLAVALDQFDNVFAADTTNRIAIFVPVMAAVNAANYKPRFPANTIGLSEAAPGMIASLFPYNYSFTDRTMNFNELPNPLPVPTELADIQVLVNDIPSPMFLVTPFQINFVVPMGVPSSGTAEFQVVQKSTGRVIAAAAVQMKEASPGLFTRDASGSGIVAALNEDGSVHSLQNRVAQPGVLQLFGTGQGFIPNAPPDGVPATGAISTPGRARVFVGGQECDVLYSGLAPNLVGVWQVNIRLNPNLVVAAETPIVVSISDISGINPANPAQIRPTIAIR
jgi:uncharacterized protein (TIGR03437 family)